MDSMSGSKHAIAAAAAATTTKHTNTQTIQTAATLAATTNVCYLIENQVCFIHISCLQTKRQFVENLNRIFHY